MTQTLYETALLEAQATNGDLYISLQLFKKVADDVGVAEPLRAQAKNNIAVILCQLGNTNEAISLWKELSTNQYYTTPEVALYNLGLLEFNHNRYEQACTYFKQALEIAPLYTDVHFYLGLVYYELNQPTAARECFASVLLHMPQHEAARYLRELI